MKTIFKLSGLLASIVFFSSCSKNNLSDSAFQQERLIKLSAELEQNYSSSSIARNSAVEKIKATAITATEINEKAPSSNDKVLRVKTNPVKTFKAIKGVKKAMKEFKKVNPEAIKNAKDTHKLNLSQNMKTGLILIIIGLLIAVLTPISYLFSVIGSILIIVGLVFILLELLDL